MKKLGWTGRWPTDEYPPNGTVIRYKHFYSEEMCEARLLSIWCGVEPVFELSDGARLYPMLDECELGGAPS